MFLVLSFIYFKIALTKMEKVGEGSIPKPAHSIPYQPSKWLSTVVPQGKTYFPQISDEVVYFRHGMLFFIFLLYGMLIISIDRSRIIYKHCQGKETF